ncbi:CubicO group peptidase (beta-lactamase class C family) [Bradyrhizobium sp. F1.13.4]
MLAPTPASPESLGMSKAALDRVDAHLKSRYIDAGRFPGTHLLVYRRGKIAHSSVQGFADVERKLPVKDDTIYRIYSMTKPLTSVAFMMLVEQGLVAIDEPVAKYIPEWKDLGVFVAGTAPAFLTRPPSRPMLIVDLLRHTSGLTYGFQQRSNVDAAYRAEKIGEVEKLRHAADHDREPRENPAGVLAGRGLELLGFDRRARLPHWQDLRHPLRAVPEATHPRSTRHVRH